MNDIYDELLQIAQMQHLADPYLASTPALRAVEEIKSLRRQLSDANAEIAKMRADLNAMIKRAEAAPQLVAQKLFTYMDGETCSRLVQEHGHKLDGPGWCQQAVLFIAKAALAADDSAQEESGAYERAQESTTGVIMTGGRLQRPRRGFVSATPIPYPGQVLLPRTSPSDEKGGE